ncbi:MAG: maleylacetoacetate isomerase [Deltaproteobacteria bacterium]|nr:maleylacetoacetate isomerase [Deltaproteobacteria bacterium]
MNDVVLYSYWRSSCSWRVRIALAYKNIPYTYRAVHLIKDGGAQHVATYRQLNPAAQVPTLQWNAAGVTRTLSQSLAILEWLEEHAPTPSLLPADPWLRAKARQYAEAINAGIQPIQNLAVGQYVRDQLGGDMPAWFRYWTARGLAALEPMVAATAGTFCVGDQPSLADCCLVPQLYNARRFQLDLAAYPTLARIDAACAPLPAFQAAHPDRQPDAE